MQIDDASIAGSDTSTDTADTNTQVGDTAVTTENDTTTSDTAGELTVANDAPPVELTLEQRVANLEASQTQLIQAIAETSKSTGMIGAQFGGIQQNLGQMAAALNAIAQRVNAMDPNRPILEVTFCQYQPTLVDGEKGAVFKFTMHNATHPEKPNQLDALRLDASNPDDPHWLPVGISAPLIKYIEEQIAAGGIAVETWTWARVREIPRPTGVSVDFQQGVDDSVPPADVAANDADATEDQQADTAETTAVDAAPVTEAVVDESVSTTEGTDQAPADAQ